MQNFSYRKEVDDWSLAIERQYSSMWGVENKPREINGSGAAVGFLCLFLNSFWEKSGSVIFDRLNFIFGLSLSLADYKYFVNTSGISLHNTGERYISIGIKHSFANYPTVIIHELSHIFFYEYLNKHPDVAVKFTENEKNEVKEIITVIINDEFKDVIFLPDDGYPNHRVQREATIREWKKNKKDFGVFLLNTLEILREAAK